MNSWQTFVFVEKKLSFSAPQVPKLNTFLLFFFFWCKFQAGKDMLKMNQECSFVVSKIIFLFWSMLSSRADLIGPDLRVINFAKRLLKWNSVMYKIFLISRKAQRSLKHGCAILLWSDIQSLSVYFKRFFNLAEL